MIRLQRVHRWIATGDAADRPDARTLGGKGAGCAWLAGLGVAVPPFVVVRAEAFAAALEVAGLTGWLDRRLHGLRASDAPAAAVEVAARLAVLTVPAELRDELAAAVEALGGQEAPLAVRSSAVDEDGAGGSFAGLHVSRLFVRGADAVDAALRDVWRSAFAPAALAYRCERGAALRGIGMAVVVQQMIDARVSGVCVTAEATTGDPRVCTVAAVWGAGEGLVSGTLDADTYAVTKHNGAIAATVAHKPTQLVARPDGPGLVPAPVPPPAQAARCCDDGQLRELVALAERIERAAGRPQDIEWCVDGAGALHVLQARAIAVVAAPGPAAGHEQLWDNANIVESYAGVTTPLTFSFIRHAYGIVYHNFARVMGVPAAVVAANRHTFEHMLGLIRGRVYYNLHHWYRLVQLFPGYRWNRGFMESMMGVREPAALAEPAAPTSRWRRWTVELPRLVRLAGRMAWRFARIDRTVDDFQARFRRLHERWAAIDLDARSPHELAALYREMEVGLLWEWKAPIINDFYVMVACGRLRRLCQRWCGDADGSLANALLAGTGEIESAEPTRELLRLAAAARAQPALAALLRDQPPEAASAAILRDGAFPAFGAELRAYLDRWGLRCANELKLESRTLRDDPRFVFRMLGNYLAGDAAALDPARLGAREHAARLAAEARVAAALRGRPWRRWRAQRTLAAARRGVRHREQLRFARTRIFGLVRELFRALGRRFASEGILDRADDVFYLTVDECWGFVDGTAVTARLRDLVALRRAEFDGYRRGDAPDERFRTFGWVHHGNRFRAPAAAHGPPSNGALHGVPCAAGTVEGVTRFLSDPTADTRLRGEILVAERTDPGWVPLYPSIGGLLIQRGSILSHSAVVAREMGVPTIVGIPGLVERLPDGTRVRMDGASGSVELLGG